MNLLEQLLDVSNNPAIQAEDDPGTALSTQTTSNKKTVRSNDSTKTCHYLNRVQCLQLHQLN